MNTTTFAGFALLLGLVVPVVPLFAHHSFAAEFDGNKQITLNGVVTRVDWVNPHIVVFLDAKGSGGNVENWRLESNPPAWFRRVVVSRNDLAKGIGQMVTVEGNRAKDGNLYMYMLKITFADGTSLELVNNANNEGSR